VRKIIFRSAVNLFCDVLYFLILIRILFSFFPINPYSTPLVHSIVEFVHRLTEPFLAPFRSLVPPLRIGGGGYLDLSPILAIIVLSLLRRLLLGLV